jgi:hypothetical protein
MEPTVPLVYGAIASVMADLSKDGIGKNHRNEQQKYAYRGIDDVYAALSPLLPKHSLIILPRVIDKSVVERESRSGGVLIYTTLTVEFDFISAKDGSSHTVRVVGEAMDSADKSCNKSLSAAYKYAAFMAFCIPVEGDNDADAQTHEPIPRQPVRQSAPADVPPGEANAFGYRPVRWPLAKMFAEPITDSQRNMIATKAMERSIPEEDLSTVRRLVLEAYGLADEPTKACASLMVDWLINAEEPHLDAAVEASEKLRMDNEPLEFES